MGELAGELVGSWGGDPMDLDKGLPTNTFAQTFLQLPSSLNGSTTFAGEHPIES